VLELSLTTEVVDCVGGPAVAVTAEPALPAMASVPPTTTLGLGATYVVRF
jgi:hypothetical protein